MGVSDELKQKLMSVFPQEDAPCGESARYEMEYEFVEQEVAKLGGLDPNSVNWSSIAQQGTVILADKSKDLAIACYLNIAWFLTEGVSGLSAGLEITEWLIENHWDSLFPEKKRMRGRIAALQWLATHLERETANTKFGKADADAANVCAERLSKISDLMVALLGGEAPSFAIAIRALKTAALTAEKQVERSKSATTQNSNTLETIHEETTQPSAATNTVKSSAPTQIATPADVPKALRAIQELLRQTASIIVSQKLEDPRAYRYSRLAAWLNIEALPAAQNGVTALRGVNSDTLARCRTYLNSGDHRNLIVEAEGAISRSPFWMDGHLMVFRALTALGPGYLAARDAVVKEVARFLERFPQVVELKFSDESPYSSDETRAWLLQDVMQDSSKEVVQAPIPALVSQAPVEGSTAPLSEANELIAQGKFKEAMQRLGAAQACMAPGRGRFLLQLAQARLCYEQNRSDLSLPQLEALEAEFSRRGLDDWEPDIARDILHLLLLSYEKVGDTRKKLGTNKGDKIQELYSRLCRLDLAGAIELNNRSTFKKLVELAYES